MRVAFYTLGCKVNQYETEIMSDLFYQNGYDVVHCDDEADVYVVNSCTVTSSGDKKARQALRRFKRNNPDAVVVLTGCFPQAFPDVDQQIPEADVITGSYNRGKVVDLVQRFLETRERVIEITPHQRQEPFEKMAVKKFTERTRAFVKIEDGCDRYCSYCIIPTARGPVRSKTMEDLKQELTDLAANGYLEVVLVGINLSSYGRDLENVRLLDAIQLACSIPGIERVRLGSLEPELLTDEDIHEMAKMEKFCPQFHLSLQSGCDATLKRMNRHYDTKEYTRIVEAIRKAFDNPSITTDIMVGFAGETDEEFQQSLEYARFIKLAKAHVFPYSIRQGTRAAKMPDQVSNAEKARRAALMAKVTGETRLEFLKTQVGKQESVLVETFHNGIMEGYTKNYTPVRINTDENLCGQIKCVKIIDVLDDKCVGELID
ncbi:tRNA (N(6)-L-threonylcarbamoyladenosine(37)-C(2))-methylthiotransferase MtaB [Massilioclostridium coli]|uniref:tRNA (N(6)-L-threonylcarbamoyladenosine(37)-C(2))- methylthiotransferase MtaB n=1 Tax=Massilioclostridium coli TaxID=1870991 RepID=UPI0022E21A3A|nr:tRNA (N(6)-L-threonylcarbamoyladenosine(37)-C(2))-methylthiotransferase MtaB [Massilioclostridium coli]